jgi:hypothetical protein
VTGALYVYFSYAVVGFCLFDVVFVVAEWNQPGSKKQSFIHNHEHFKTRGTNN